MDAPLRAHALPRALASHRAKSRATARSHHGGLPRPPVPPACYRLARSQGRGGTRLVAVLAPCAVLRFTSPPPPLQQLVMPQGSGVPVRASFVWAAFRYAPIACRCSPSARAYTRWTLRYTRSHSLSHSYPHPLPKAVLARCTQPARSFFVGYALCYAVPLPLPLVLPPCLVCSRCRATSPLSGNVCLALPCA